MCSVCSLCCFLFAVENTKATEGPLQTFNDLVKSGKLKLDLFQQRVISEHFQRLYSDLQSYEPTGSSLLGKVSFII